MKSEPMRGKPYKPNFIDDKIYKNAVAPYPSAGMIKIDLSNAFSLDEMKYS